jgi:hypothetical protein
MKRPAGRTLTLLLTVTAIVGLSAAVWPGGALATHAPPGTQLWGYEAAGGSARILEYDIGTDTFTSSCVPDPTANGRGIAEDPSDGNLWYTRVTGFAGDGLIHKTTPPPTCLALPDIPFDDGPGGSTQDGIGALDVDPDDGNLWAAGYDPVGSDSYLYKVNSTTGALIASCHVPFGGGGLGNDTLTEAKLTGLPGSGSYLLTDAGELTTSPDDLLVVDEATCTGGGPGTIVTSYPKSVQMSGVDYELSKLLATDGSPSIYDLGGPPFGPPAATMSTAPAGFLEDITLKAIKVTPPTPCAIKITNGGWIVTDDGDRGSFGGVAKETITGVDSGNEEYQDHGPADPMNVHSLVITDLICDSDTTKASIFGTATIDGTGVHPFQIDVQDNGEPGKGNDHYRIRIPDVGYDSGDHILRGGNVQIH